MMIWTKESRGLRTAGGGDTAKSDVVHEEEEEVESVDMLVCMRRRKQLECSYGRRRVVGSGFVRVRIEVRVRRDL